MTLNRTSVSQAGELPGVIALATQDVDWSHNRAAFSLCGYLLDEHLTLFATRKPSLRRSEKSRKPWSSWRMRSTR